ncbi:MAG TPA: minichromosome maintenance protein MCM [Candidatus Poseidoniaceae archaeon]|nr:minichromosome maintenance protein MCM [Candidatus Poseidoniaceae archaeon]|tara:strand:+ start:202 stop:1107 length:906 start_codon:yes stop_codon:yes gene_type:complete
MSFGRTELGPEAETQELMNAFGAFILDKHQGDLVNLGTCEEEIFSFEVEWNDLCSDPVIQGHLVDNLDRFMTVAEQVLNDRFIKYMQQPCRLVLRLNGLTEQHKRRLDSLRMRDRRKLFSFDTLIVGRTPPLGYLKRAAYACAAKGCTYVGYIEQRLARQRESPGQCPVCAERYLAGLAQEEREMAMRFLPRSKYRMNDEELRYIDVQYLSVMDVVPDGDGPWSIGQHVWTAVVDEDFVDEYPVGSLVRLHATVHVDHLPERTFDKDTRRVMILRVEGIEMLDEPATHFDDVTWTSEPSWR